MARKSRFTEAQRRWWQNELTKYYQRLNDPEKEIDMSNELWSWIDEWVTNYNSNIVDCKAKIIEKYCPEK